MQSAALQAEAIELSLDFGAEAVEGGFRVRPRAGSALAQGIGPSRGLPVALLPWLPPGATLAVAGDARTVTAAEARSLGTNFEWLDVLEPQPKAPVKGAPTPPEVPSARAALQPVLDLVRREFLWSVHPEPGAQAATFFLVARLAQPDASLWTKLGPAGAPLPVAYRIGAVEVHRLEGSGRWAPADLALVGDELFVSAGRSSRALLEGVLGGRLARGPSAQPSFAAALAERTPGAFVLATADLPALLRLIADTPPEAAAEPGTTPSALVYELATDGSSLEARWRLPHAQLDRLAPLWREIEPPGLRNRPDTSEWLFPEGI